MIAFLTNLYLIVMLSGAVFNIRCSAAGITEALFKVGECDKLYDTNKADLIYLRNSRELLLVDIIGYLQVFGIEPYGLIPWILNIFCLLSVKWRQ